MISYQSHIIDYKDAEERNKKQENHLRIKTVKRILICFCFLLKLRFPYQHQAALRLKNRKSCVKSSLAQMKEENKKKRCAQRNRDERLSLSLTSWGATVVTVVVVWFPLIEQSYVVCSYVKSTTAEKDKEGKKHKRGLNETTKKRDQKKKKRTNTIVQKLIKRQNKTKRIEVPFLLRPARKKRSDEVSPPPAP